MAKRRVTVHPVPGARSSGRVIACLVIEGNDDINAWPEVLRIDQAVYKSGIEERNNVGARFRHWASGAKRREFHHGWPDDPKFSMGYVFRWDHQRQHRRLYGFLAYPRPGLEVCILCCFRSKDKWRTDTAIKKMIRALSEDGDVKEAIKQVFSRWRQE